MEELAFFNEREAECFEREDTLSQTDLEKLNVDEDMPEMERTEHLLKMGLDKQKVSVLMSLPTILAASNSKGNFALVLDCVKMVWKKCEAEANTASTLPLEIFKALANLATTTVDGKVLSFQVASLHEDFVEQAALCEEEKRDAVFLLTEEQVTKQLIPLALDMIAETQFKDYAEAASLMVIAALPRLAGTIKKTQILRVALEKGDVSQSPGSRLICCLVLGAITALKLLSSQDIEALYFQKMIGLCQDTDSEVRKCMCIQLDALARAVSEEMACNELLPELLELLQDEEEQVKQMAFLTLLSLLDYFPASERSKMIIPELQSIADSVPDYLMVFLAEHFGSMVTKLAALNHLGNDTMLSFLQSYSRLCVAEEDEIRQYCAYNFPAIVKAFGTTYMPVLMDDLLVKLGSDPAATVRHHIAAGIHEVALLLGPPRATRCLKTIMLALLKDDSPEVQSMMLARMPALMASTFSMGDEDQTAAALDVTLKAVVHCHSILDPSRNRDQISFVETLEQLPTWCSADQMYEMVIPILFDLIEDGARPVQTLATRTVVKCIRRNDSANHRFALLNKLRTEYGHARSYWRRLLYLDACVCALEINSHKYCRLNFLDIALELLEDGVPNVRLRAISLLPLWKAVITSLADDKMLDRIRQFMDECAVDSDRDVANTIAEVKQILEASELNGLQQRHVLDDNEDKRRLSEEDSRGFMSDHEDTSADSKWSSMLEYTLVVGKDGQVVRRARVKSLELSNKLPSRSQGKDAARGNGAGSSAFSSSIGGMGNGLNGGMNGTSGLASTLGLGNVGSINSSMGSIGMGGKVDQSNRGKTGPKTPSKAPGPSGITTLPNCASARPSNTSVMATKMPPAIKILGATGKPVGGISGSKSASGTSRSSTAISKESSGVTKIPIIRPSAPAGKRETSPSGGFKPSSLSAGSVGSGGGGPGGGGGSGPPLMSSSVGNGLGSSAPAGSGLAVAAMKNKLGSIESSTVHGAGPLGGAAKVRAGAPSSASKR